MTRNTFFILLFSVALAKTASSQLEDMSKYYPADTLYKKLKVKSVTESYTLATITTRVNEYDTEGRQTHSYYIDHRNEGSQYIRHGDTLFRFMYSYPENKGLYSAEQFIYNSKGKIIKYILYRKDYHGRNSMLVSMDEIFYNKKDEISSLLSYYRDPYPDTLRKDMPISKDLLKLSDVVYYEHYIIKGQRQVIGKHAIGKLDYRSTDTLYYDRKNRLTRKASFARRGFRGEMGFSHLTEIISFQYSAGKRTKTSYYTHCMGYDDASHLCLGSIESEHDYNEYVYSADGLLKEEYSGYGESKKTLFCTYTYSFYE